jgi:hypothetical protein
MTTHEPQRRREERPERRRELEAVLRDLDACIARIHVLIPRVHAVIDRRTEAVRPQARPRVVNFGGPSAFRVPGPPAPKQHNVRGSQPLIVAADLALAGYSRDQIRGRLQSWDDQAASLALENLYE